MADSNFNWLDLIGPAATFGGQILGQRSQQAMSREQIAENKRQFDIAQANQQANRAQEVNRRNIFQEASAPAMLGAIGYRNPDQINAILGKMKEQSAMAQMRTPQQGMVASNMAAAPQQSGGSNVLGKVAGTAGLAATGLGLAKSLGANTAGIGSALGGATAALPVVGAVLGGTLLAKHFIGQGRKAADVLTKPGGMQNAFESTLREIDQMGLDPAEAWKMKTDAYHELVNLGTQHAQKGSNEKKVVTQMFDVISPLFGDKNPLRN